MWLWPNTFVFFSDASSIGLAKSIALANVRFVFITCADKPEKSWSRKLSFKVSLNSLVFAKIFNTVVYYWVTFSPFSCRLSRNLCRSAITECFGCKWFFTTSTSCWYVLSVFRVINISSTLFALKTVLTGICKYSIS